MQLAVNSMIRDEFKRSCEVALFYDIYCKLQAILYGLLEEDEFYHQETAAKDILAVMDFVKNFTT